MRLLRLIRSLDPRLGGPTEHIRAITPLLAAQGVATTLVCFDDPAAPWLQSSSATVALGPGWGTYGYSSGVMARLMTLARSHDLLMIDGLWQFNGLAGWRVARRLGLPHVVTVHGMLDPWFKRRYPLKHLRKQLYWGLVEARVVSTAERVLFTTTTERDLARDAFWPYAAREQVVSYGSLEPPGDPQQQREALFEAFPQLRGRRFALFLGRIHPKKGTDLLIQAFARHARAHPDLQLVIAGPDLDGWRSELEGLATNLGLGERLLWTGMLSGDLKWGALHTAELFCLPSHQENFGIAVCEALSCRLPVLLGHPVNIADQVHQAGAGIAHADSVEGTAAALGQWLNADAQSRQAMALRARALFERRFDLVQTARELAGVLHEVRP